MSPRAHCPLCFVNPPPGDMPGHVERCHAEEVAQRRRNPDDPVIPRLRALGAFPGETEGDTPREGRSKR